MGTYYNIQSYLTDAGGLPLVIDIATNEPDGHGGYWLYMNQQTGNVTQWWTIVDGPSGYVFIESQWKDPDGNHVVIDIHGASNQPGTRLDGYPQKSTNNDNQLWARSPATLYPGFVFFQSKLTDPEGQVLVIDVAGGSPTVATPLDAYPQKMTGYENQIWTLAG